MLILVVQLMFTLWKTSGQQLFCQNVPFSSLASTCQNVPQDVDTQSQVIQVIDMKDKKTLKCKEVAQYIGVPLRTFYRMLRDHRFSVEPIPNTKPRLWNKDSVDAWLQGQ